MNERFRVEQIDHVELFVPDRYEAAAWYNRILGLDIVLEYEHWSDDPGGPLMISTPGAETKLALFSGEAQNDKKTDGFHRVAFRVSGKSFLQFLEVIDSLDLLDHTGKKVKPTDYNDHQKAFSIYFCDPWGHRLEITTYEYEVVRANLN